VGGRRPAVPPRPHGQEAAMKLLLLVTGDGVCLAVFAVFVDDETEGT
jgi:hypothetical protein